MKNGIEDMPEGIFPPGSADSPGKYILKETILNSIF